MDLLLHIGCEKTGTTSLQFWFDYNAESLVKRGIFYSAVLGRPNNRRLSFYGMAAGTPDEGLPADGVFDAEQHAALQQRIARDLPEEVRAAQAAGCTTFVISNEHLHSRVTTPDAVRRVWELLEPLFDRIEVYCFVRSQMDVCLSLASTMARNGREVSREWIDRQVRPSIYYDMDRLLNLWAGVFGEDAMRPVAFRRHSDTIGFFEARLGLQKDELPRRAPANEALDYRVMMLTNAIASANLADRQGGPARRFFINELPIEQRLTIDRAAAQALQARLDASNAAVSVRWPDIHADDLTPDWSRYPEHGNIDQLDAANPTGRFLSLIFDRMNAQAAFIKAKMHAVSAERDGLLDRLESGVRNCEEGIEEATRAAAHEPYRPRMEALITQLNQRAKRLQRRMAVRLKSA